MSAGREDETALLALTAIGREIEERAWEEREREREREREKERRRWKAIGRRSTLPPALLKRRTCLFSVGQHLLRAERMKGPRRSTGARAREKPRAEQAPRENIFCRPADADD